MVLRNVILKTFGLSIIILLLFSCNKNSKPQQSNATETAREDSLKLELKLKKYEVVQLNPKADSLVKDWAMYESLKNEVERLDRYTLQDMISNIPTLEKAVDSLQKTVPAVVDTFPVKSRINVLNTKAKQLLMLSEKQQPKLLQIKRIAEEYPFEFNALNIQLNEVFIELPEFED